jgi:hypothetical protein
MKPTIITVPVLVTAAALIGWLVLKRKSGGIVHEDKDTLKVLYFETGLQYYISGRYSAIAGFIPISGNLFHHAFEMLIKGYLAQDLDQSARIRLGHDLTKLWKLYRTKIGDPALDRFDRAIASLDKFEDIRYPERVAKSGMTATIDFARPGTTPATVSSTGRRLRAYDFNVYELDELLKVVFAKSSLNLGTFTSALRRDASEYLNR